MKLLSILLLFILIFPTNQLFSQTDDDWDSRTYNVGEFNKISLEGNFRVYLIQGKKCSLTVHATDSDLFDNIEVNNFQSTLKTEVKRKPFDFEHVTLYITFRTLEDLKIEGGVNLKTKGYLDLGDLYVHVEGGAKIELDIKAEDVGIIGEGGVMFEVQGVAETLDVKVSGAGHVDASELKTKDVKFRVEGVGTGNVYATETLYAKIEGVGKVKYRGNPKVSKDIEGLGTVVKD